MMTSSRVPVPGGHLAFLDRGPRSAAAPPVVLLHGGALDHRMWRPQVEALAGRRVLAPDARGHGASSTPEAPYRHCDDVVALLDALEVERAVLVGLSMGGSTAVDVALEAPDRVAGLVVSGTGTSEPEWTDPWVLGIQQRWAAAAAAGDADGWVAAFLEFVPGPHRTREDVDPAVWSLVEEMARNTLARHVRVDGHGVPLPPVLPTPVTRTWERLPDVQVPLAVVVGALDADDHLRMARRLADAVPRSRLTVVEGTAHYPNLERPEAFDAAVLDLLREVGG